MSDFTPTQQALFDEHADMARNYAARRSEHARLLPDQLQNAALRGLAEAVVRFDPTRGARFTTFAYRRICGAIRDEVREHRWWGRTAHHGHNRTLAPAFTRDDQKGDPYDQRGTDPENLCGERALHLPVPDHAALVEMRDLCAFLLSAVPLRFRETVRRLLSRESCAQDEAAALGVSEQRVWQVMRASVAVMRVRAARRQLAIN